MKPGKAHRYYRRLRKEKEREGERRGGGNFITTQQNNEHGEDRNGLVGLNVEIKQRDSEKRAKTKKDMK